jgi:hypothetical protein
MGEKMMMPMQNQHTTDGPRFIWYQADNLPDAEAVACRLGYELYMRERPLKTRPGQNPSVRREFLVLPDARECAESDLFMDRVPK